MYTGTAGGNLSTAPVEGERASMTDKQFWQSIIDTDYTLPKGASQSTLTTELLSYLASPDPQVREIFAYSILDAWIHRDCYSPAELGEMVTQLLRNLLIGLGESRGDSAFQRSSSLLILTEILYHDLTKPALSRDQVRVVLEAGVSYFLAERDLRGYDPKNGWIHAIAHAADLFWVLAQHSALESVDLERILKAMAEKIAAPVEHVYLYDEELRLVRAVMGVLQRDILSLDYLSAWLLGLTHPEGRTSWSGTFDGPDGGTLMAVVRSPEETGARHNARSFLYALYFQLRSPGFGGISFVDQAPPRAGALLALVERALAEIRAWC